MKRYLFFILLFYSAKISAQVKVIDTTFKRPYILKVQTYLDRSGTLDPFYSITDKGISIYSSQHAKSIDSVEFFMEWNYLSQFKYNTEYFDTAFYKSIYCKNRMNEKYIKALHHKMTHIKEEQTEFIFPPPPPLKGKRIAIDPGHIGGTKENAKRERKMVNVKNDSIDDGEEDPLIEGNLTMQTALLLKKKLEAQGAKVMLTRKGEGENAFGYSFEDWMKKNFKKAVKDAFRSNEISEGEKKKLLDPKTKPGYIFRYFFLQEELKQRAKKINEFQPQITIVIHYNADENNLHGNKTGEKNFNMVFIPGSFMEGEMDTKRDRYEFLRLLTSNDIEDSKKAADKLITSFVKTLNVPAAGTNDASYLKDKCIATETKGVYCRNLAVSRFVHGTIIYGESLYQDNINEFKSLTESPTPIDGVKTNQRVAQVAEAYYQALLQIFK